MLTLHQDYQSDAPSLAPVNGAGPSFSCVRNAVASAIMDGFTDFSLRQEAEVAINTPRFDGFFYHWNGLVDPDDLSTVNWTKNNCTVAKDATDYYGRANGACTITDDATNGQHYVYQQCTHPGRERLPNGRIETVCMVYIDPAQSTAEYATFSAQDSVNNTQTGFTVRLSDGVVVDPAEYYEAGGGGMDMHSVQVMPNGWLAVAWADFLSTGEPRIAIGFNATGVTDTGGSYVGTGDTLVVQYPYSSIYYGVGSQFLWAGFGPYPGWGNESGWSITREFPQHSTLHNSIWKGYTVERGIPERPWYSDLYGWNPGTQTAQAEALPGEDYSAYQSFMGDNADAMKIRVTGVDQQYWIGWQQFWYAQINEGSWYTVSMKIEDMSVAPSGALLDLSELNNVVSSQLTAGVDDMDEEGYVCLTFRLGHGVGDYYANIRFGLGADGNNDTGTFTMSEPQINFGKHRVQFIPNDGTSSVHIMPSTTDKILLPAKGLHVERASTNLLQNPCTHNTAPWVTTIGANGELASGYSSLWSIGRGTRQYGEDTVRGEVGVEQPVTLSTSTEYTITHICYYWQNYIYVGVRNHGALDIGVYVSTLPGEALPQIEAVGADVTSATVRAYTANAVIIELTFTSDAVDTTGDVVIRNPDNLSDLECAMTGNYLYQLYTQLEEGKATSLIGNEGAATRTREADVISASDVTWWGSPGTMFIGFEFERDVLNKTVFSIHDTTANERVTLATNGSGNLIFEIVDGGVTQVSIDCGVVTPGAYNLAFTLDGSDLSLALNGVIMGTDSSYTLPTVTQINLGSDHAGANQLDGWIKSVWFDDAFMDNDSLRNTSTNSLPSDDSFIVDLAAELVTTNDDTPVS